ncbi:MAG: phosphate acyltransferase PlsX [Clostridia bacterium]|nr:phosphate acyltransferase PlsX [Clostridia bacterium]
MKLALDAMGGDHAPQAVVEGALLALDKLDTDVSICLYGQEDRIKACLDGKTYPADRLSICHCEEVIGCDEAPAVAVRRKKNSSMVMAAKAVADGEADCFISAGSTGAVLSCGTLVIRRIKGVQRPALAPLIPNLQGSHTMIIDAGANVDCKPLYLTQFAQMGSAYMELVEGIREPAVGLLNNGEEAEKGNELSKETYPLLQNLAGIHFVGNCEARELMSGDFDVVVTDGFAGNVLLKSTEGTAKAVTAMLKTELMGSLRGTIGAAIAKPAFTALKKKMDYTEVGGAPLLGVNGGVIKAHGSSNAKAFYNAILQADRLVRFGVTDKIASAVQAEEV